MTINCTAMYWQAGLKRMSEGVRPKSQEGFGQAHLATAIRAELGIENHVRAYIHQGNETQHWKRRLAFSTCIARAKMLSQLRRVGGSQQCTIHREHPQPVPVVAFVSLTTPLLACLAEPGFDRVGTQPLTRFSHATAR